MSTQLSLPFSEPVFDEMEGYLNDQEYYLPELSPPAIRSISLSGGKNSSALALWLCLEHAPDIPWRLTFADTGVEFPEVYEYLDRLERHLGRPIERIKNKWCDFFQWLLSNGGFLPAPWGQACTADLKVRAMKKFFGKQRVATYIGITDDEPGRVHADRRQAKGANFLRAYPFVLAEKGDDDCWSIMKRHGLDDHPLYKIKGRSGCWTCFYQSAWTWWYVWKNYTEQYLRMEFWEKYNMEIRPGLVSRDVKGRAMPYALNLKDEDTGEILTLEAARAKFDAGWVPKDKRDHGARCGSGGLCGT